MRVVEIRFLGERVEDEVQARIRAALSGVGLNGALVELRHRGGAFGVLAYTEAPKTSSHWVAPPRPPLSLRDRVEDALRGLGLVVL